jgi:hypothetical protein
MAHAGTTISVLKNNYSAVNLGNFADRRAFPKAVQRDSTA